MITQIKKEITQIACLTLLILVVVTLAGAQESQEEKATVNIKEMAGNVIYFSPRHEPTVIAIGNDARNTDYSFIIDKDTKVAYKKSLSEIKVGDIVKVTYAEIVKSGKGGIAMDQRVAKIIGFVKAGEKTQRPKPESEDEATGAKTLVSD